MRRTVALALGLAVLAGAAPAPAALRRVPADVPTIAAALAASAPGDSVLVAPGTWSESVVLPPDVSLLADGPPGAATIDGGLGGTCVDAQGGGPSSRLERFRLVRGRGGADPGGTVGGVLRVQGGALRVVDCAFDDGQATFGGATAGIGTAVTFVRCTWSASMATFGGGHFQAGGTLRLEDAVFLACRATHGGGLFATNGAGVTVLGARVKDARALGDGGGAHLDGGVTTLSLVRFEDTAADGTGGGLAVRAGGQVIASHCTFLRASSGGGGGAFHVSCEAAAPGLGGGPPLVAAADCALLSLTNATIVAAHGAPPAAGAVTGPGVVRVASSLVAANASGLACLDSRATLDVTCSDLVGNQGPDLGGACAPVADPDNRALDPHLCDLAGGDVSLCANSPLADPGCGDGLWGSTGVGCADCGNTPAAPTSWGRVKVRYR